jgi:hypothetical protein
MRVSLFFITKRGKLCEKSFSALIFGYFSIKLARLPAGKAGLWREKSTEELKIN